MTSHHDSSEPTPEQLMRLHEALLHGDRSGSEHLAALLFGALKRRFRREQAPDAHTIDSLIGLSIARYLSDPGRYRPERAPLLAYLWQDVKGDLRNEWASDANRRGREIPTDDWLEVGAPGRNPSLEEEVLDAIEPFDLAAGVARAALLETEQFGAQDRELLALMADQVRETAPFAEALGIAHLPIDVQRAEVKRHKDRLKARLGGIRDRLSRPDR